MEEVPSKDYHVYGMQWSKLWVCGPKRQIFAESDGIE